MALDRWIALIFLLICLVYGYTAFFTMDGQLPPFMQRNPVWPSTFPKVLSVLGVALSLAILLGWEKASQSDEPAEIDYRRLLDYNLGQALILIGLMIVYALVLRPIGFIAATSGFLILGPLVLGDRRWHLIIPIALVATICVWYLVQQVLGIFLRPWPMALAG